mmetsp:Transcript_25212/g.41007  ORF Transcript_25212/g.41007 Transcript_25212/m.41007 type:complete len:228 (-) Transcript_25212:181-864(-)
MIKILLPSHMLLLFMQHFTHNRQLFVKWIKRDHMLSIQLIETVEGRIRLITCRASSRWIIACGGGYRRCARILRNIFEFFFRESITIKRVQKIAMNLIECGTRLNLLHTLLLFDVEIKLMIIAQECIASDRGTFPTNLFDNIRIHCFEVTGAMRVQQMMEIVEECGGVVMRAELGIDEIVHGIGLRTFHHWLMIAVDLLLVNGQQIRCHIVHNRRCVAEVETATDCV